MPNFADRLLAAVKQKGNPVCVGLDPRLDQLPRELRARAERDHGRTPRAAAEAILAFNRALLDALADVAPVCKPQIAFYEEHGAEGLRAYAETIRHAQGQGLLVISDAKRGDIGTTAEAYARAHLTAKSGGFDADALTVNPYLGAETLQPYLDAGSGAGKGIFVLVKTSNPGSGDLQDMPVNGRPLYERVAEMVRKLGAAHRGASGFSAVGAVVGATYPEQARQLREMLPETIFLVPGYGAQGATAKDVAAAFRADGQGAVVNSSRGIIFAYQQEPYAKRYGEAGFAAAARAAAEQMAKELSKALGG
jgi:orotidine-5'-phosphate decarboxylase